MPWKGIDAFRGEKMIDLPINLKSEDDFEPLELEIWFDSGFSTQIGDMRPEVLKLRGYEGDAFLLNGMSFLTPWA